MTQKMLNELQRSVSDFVRTLVPSPRSGESRGDYIARADLASDYVCCQIYNFLAGRLSPCKRTSILDFDLMYRYACSLYVSGEQEKALLLRHGAEEGNNNKQEGNTK